MSSDHLLILLLFVIAILGLLLEPFGALVTGGMIGFVYLLDISPPSALLLGMVIFIAIVIKRRRRHW